MAVLQTFNLRDFLRLPDDDPARERRTLGSVLKIDDARSHHGRSLMDVFDSDGSPNGHRLGWKSFVQCLGFLRASAIPCHIPTGRPAADEAETAASPEARPRAETVQRTSVSLATALAAETEREDPDVGPADGDGSEPMRMTLMALLEASEGEVVMGPASSLAAAMLREWVASGGKDDAGDGEGDRDSGGEKGSEGHACCVCMVRQKGAAFIPCGHTFCRDCSRELWVNRGSCPRCNVFILEILDIF
ncbi:hypothetical protein EJ110_NYTH20569 [Nymphaea thermarum]|nr:hypothetical protein EJ110_NYTH20569 [Nymphaea thermarum]